MVKEQTLSKRPTVLYTVVRADPLGDGRYSIGLHASHLMAAHLDGTLYRRRRIPMALWLALIAMAGLVAASMIL